MRMLCRFDNFELRKSFWTQRIYVVDTTTGGRVRAAPAMIAQFQKLLAYLEPLDLPASDKEGCLNYAAMRFMATVLYPDAPPARMFLTAEPAKFFSYLLSPIDPAELGIFPSSSRQTPDRSRLFTDLERIEQAENAFLAKSRRDHDRKYD